MLQKAVDDAVVGGLAWIVLFLIFALVAWLLTMLRKKIAISPDNLWDRSTKSQKIFLVVVALFVAYSLLANGSPW